MQSHFLPGTDETNSELLAVSDSRRAIGSLLLGMAGVARWQY